MAIAALLVWMCTAAAGGYLLASRARPAGTPEVEPAPQHEPGIKRQPASVARPPVPGPPLAEPAVAPEPRRAKDRFDPPSLVRAKSEPMPGLRALAEFAHPTLALTGFGFWAGYVLTGDRVFAVIGFGVLLGTICAGLSWFTASTRAARRGQRGALAPSLSPRVLVLHGAGAALTLLLTALIAARV